MDDITLLTYLHQLRDVMYTRESRRPSWFDSTTGLCCNFDSMVWRATGGKYSYAFMGIPRINAAVNAWPHFTGHNMFIIPDPKGSGKWGIHDAAEYAYHDTDVNKYDRRSAYCRLRYDLIDHIIKHVESVIESSSQ